MKRFCTMLLVVILAVSIFPPGALAVQGIPHMRAEIDEKLSYYRTFCPAGFDYYITAYSISAGSEGFIIYFFNSPDVIYGSSPYCVWTGGTNGEMRMYTRAMLKVTSGGFQVSGNRTSNGQLSHGPYFQYFVTDRSTATFSNMDDLVRQLDYDPFVEVDGDWEEPEPDPVDTTELETLIVQAEAIEDIGYTFTSWSRLKTAIASGKSLLAGASYTQPQVDSAASTLRSAMNSLVVDPGPWEPPPDPGDHRYLIDGLTTADLFPAYQAIMENISTLRVYGLAMLGMVILVPLLVRILKRLVLRR